MANNHFYATYYGEVATNDPLNGGYSIKGSGYGAYGEAKSFPSALCEFKAISPMQFITTGGSTVTIQAEVIVYPNGLNKNGVTKSYVTDSNILTLNTLAS
jgi:hypothetical protein